MVGQDNNKAMVRKWKTSAFPRFMIITGDKGSGKKTLAYHIAANILNCTMVMPDNGVDVVRDTIELAYKCGSPTCYIFRDADKMSPQAKNALLKVTEEPPRQAYFIMTVEDINNTLVTLKSRATEIKMEPYTQEELTDFLCRFESLPCGGEDIINIASNPGQCLQLMAMNCMKFLEFCDSVIDNIATVSGVNAFKIGQYFKYKDDGEGYDIPLFFNCMMYALKVRVLVNMSTLAPIEIYKHTQAIELCSKYKNEMKITGIKKDATMDMFILELRDLFLEDQYAAI